MIIAICGAQGVGKTTLLNALKQNKLIKNYEFRDEVTRWVKSLGLNINEQGNDQTQRLITMKHIYNLRMTDGNMITDRSMLDCLVYSRYLYELGQLSKDGMIEVEKAFRQTRNEYDITFYIEPEVSLVDDGVRSVSEDFRKRIIELFEIAIFEDMNDEVERIKGTVEERANQIINRILYSL